MITVGVVGHRTMERPAALSFVVEQSANILKSLLDAGSGVIALSAVAEGADTVFAEAAIELHVPLEIVIPFDEYDTDFTSPEASLRYRTLCSRADRIISMPYVHRSDEAYLAAMNWVLDHSAILVAAWDGHPSRGSGGTATAVQRAISLDCTWIHVNVSDLTVAFHLARQSDTILNESFMKLFRRAAT